MDLPTVPALLTRAAERFGDAPFLTSGERTASFAGIAAEVARRAGDLRARGVEPGDRVLLAGRTARS